MTPVDMLDATRERLAGELEHLRTRALIDARALVEFAQGAGDIGENTDVANALFEVGRIEQRIAYLADLVGRARVHDAGARPRTGPDTVAYATVVTVAFGPGDCESYLFAGIEDRVEGIETITSSSPLGRAVCGRAVGDRVEVEGPNGSFTVTIDAIETLSRH